MSIKTTKRLALGVIASLVLAPFAAIAPASAAAITNTTSLPTVGTATQTAIVGQSVTTTVGFTHAGTALTLAGSDTATFTATTVTIAKPTGSTVTLADNDGAGGGSSAAFSTTGGTTGLAGAVNTTTGAVTSGTVTADVALGAIVAGTITIVPDAPGTYTVTVSTGAGTTAVATITVRSLAYTTGDGAPATPFSTGAGVAGAFNTVTVTAQTTRVANVDALVTVSGAGATIESGTNTPTIATDKLSARITQATASALVIRTPQAGTITVSLFNETAADSGLFSPTAANTVTITVNAAAIGGVFNASKSTSVIAKVAGAPTTAATDDVVVADNRIGATAQAANIVVTVLDGNSAAVNSGTVSAIISGPGLLGISNNEATTNAASTGRAVSVATTGAGSNNKAVVTVWPDRTGAGVATVTISVGTTVVATETVTFYGAVASYSVTVNKAHVANTGVAESGVFSVTAKDSAGTAIPSETIYASAGTSTIGSIDASAVTSSTGVASFSATGVSTKFGAVPVTFGNAASSATITAASSFGVSSPRAATIAITSDKTSYLPGELMTITFTANDANGLGLPNASYAADTLLANSASNPLPSHSFPAVPFLGTAAVALKAGVATATAYAPLVEGPVSFVWTVAGTAGGTATTNLAAALLGTKITLSVAVAKPVVPVVVPEVVYDKPTLSFVKDGGRIILSGTAVDGEGDIIIYTKKIGTTAWKERAKTLEVAAPGDFNGSIKALKNNVVIRVKQEGTGLFSNQVIVVK